MERRLRMRRLETGCKLTSDTQGEVVRLGLPASGMFIINPPHTLKADLQASLETAAER